MIIGDIKKDIDKEESAAKKAGKIAAAAIMAPGIATGAVVEVTAEAVIKAAGATGRAAEAAGKAVGETFENVVEAFKGKNIEAQMKKYSPLFMEQYEQEEFNIPNIIVLVEDVKRRNVEVCKGSMGWLSKSNEIEVLNLYDKSVERSGLTFEPAAVCDTIYYVDPHDEKRFINLDNYYSVIQQQKLAELADIAISLGASSYTVEIVEEINEVDEAEQKGTLKANVKMVEADATAEIQKNAQKECHRRALSSGQFSCTRTPIAPRLCWFKNDANINVLIKHALNGTCAKVQDIEFSGSVYSSIASNMAMKIDAVVKEIGVKSSANISQKSKKEYSSKMVFHIEF